MRTPAPSGIPCRHETRDTFTLRRSAVFAALTLALTAPIASAQDALLQSDAFDYDESRRVLTMAPMVARVAPGVVSINTVESEEADGSTLGGIGSGVVIDAGSGLIVTNYHVIEGAQDIRVTFEDRRRLKAVMLGHDEATDLALLRVEPTNLTQVPLAPSDDVRVGDYVVAIGNPYGLNSTVTTGIVSAIGREGDAPLAFSDFIQTDASINPGNSGGALLNTAGEIVGINASVLSSDGGYSGIGFAIPVQTVRHVVTQLRLHGEVKRGRIGVMIQRVTGERMDALGLPDLKGALVTDVVANAPASEAGLKRNDVILRLGEREIIDSSDLRHAVGLAMPGDRLSIDYLRDGATYSSSIEVGEMPAEREATLQAWEG